MIRSPDGLRAAPVPVALGNLAILFWSLTTKPYSHLSMRLMHFWNGMMATIFLTSLWLCDSRECFLA